MSHYAQSFCVYDRIVSTMDKDRWILFKEMSQGADFYVLDIVHGLMSVSVSPEIHRMWGDDISVTFLYVSKWYIQNSV